MGEWYVCACVCVGVSDHGLLFHEFGIAHSLIVGLQYDLFVDVEREKSIMHAHIYRHTFRGFNLF